MWQELLSDSQTLGVLSYIRSCVSLPLNPGGMSHKLLDVQGEEPVDTGWIQHSSSSVVHVAVSLRNVRHGLVVVPRRCPLLTRIEIAKQQVPHVLEIEKFHGLPLSRTRRCLLLAINIPCLIVEWSSICIYFVRLERRCCQHGGVYYICVRVRESLRVRVCAK